MLKVVVQRLPDVHSVLQMCYVMSLSIENAEVSEVLRHVKEWPALLVESGESLRPLWSTLTDLRACS